MPARDIKKLRESGELAQALTLAKAELQADPGNIWPKRNISWVYYDYLKQNSSLEQFDAFILWLNELKNLELPPEETMLFEQLCWQVGKMAFILLKNNPQDHNRGIQLFEAIKTFHFPKLRKEYSALFRALHKLLKDTNRYIEFADWWGLRNFIADDFKKEKMPNGREVMAIVEQAYINYAKHLLPKQTQNGETIFDKAKAEAFLPDLTYMITEPTFQYLSYFKAKLLLALGDKDSMLEALLPFAQKKRNDFWVWELLAEAYSNDPEKVFACYCRALMCKSPEEMLINLRQKMAKILISKNLYNEARTEIDLLVQARTEHNFKIPAEIANWQTTNWYKTAEIAKSNLNFYKKYAPAAEALLFSDVPEVSVIVEFVNSERKILNFIASETKFGFFKYDRLVSEVKIGETLKVRLEKSDVNGGIHQVYTATKFNDEELKKQFTKEVSAVVKIPVGKPFGFIDDVFIHPSILTKYKLKDGMPFTGRAIRSYKEEKKEWGWKLI